MKHEWIKEELSLLDIAHVVQQEPYIINLSESRSSFHMGLSSLFSCKTWQMGHSESDRPLLCSSADNSFVEMSAKLLLEHVGDQNFWITSRQGNPSFLSSLPAPRPNSITASCKSPQLQRDDMKTPDRRRISCQHEAGKYLHANVWEKGSKVLI